MRILSVDDSATTRLFIKRAVDLLGFEFLEASNGKEGMDVVECKMGHIDLILLDWHMPVMDGIEMLKALKANEMFNPIPVSMVTVNEDTNKIEEALDLGATNYLIKPFSKVELVGKIMEGLGQEM